MNTYSLTDLALVTESTNPLTALSVANGNMCPNNGVTFLVVSNSSGATATLTVEVPVTVDVNLAVANRAYTIPANTNRTMVGPFRQSVYGPTLLVDTSSASLSAAGVSLI